MSSTVVNLGHVPVNRGNYTSEEQYYKDNVVQYRNGSYIAHPSEQHHDGVGEDNLYYLTRAPYTVGSDTLNPGWDIFSDVGIIDEVPTAMSTHLVESGGVFDAINDALEEVSFHYPSNVAPQNFSDEEKEMIRGNIDVNIITDEQFDSGYYNFSSYNVGDKIKRTSAPNNDNYKCCVLEVKAGKYVKVYGYNYGEVSRLWVAVSKENGRILGKANANIDARQTPDTVSCDLFDNFDGDFYIYITSYISNIVKAKVVSNDSIRFANVKVPVTDMAIVVGTPEITTSSSTSGVFTLPAGSNIITNYSQYTAVSALSVSHSGYGSCVVIFDTIANNLYAVNSNATLKLAEKDIPIAIIRWSSGVYRGNFAEYLYNGKRMGNVGVDNDYLELLSSTYTIRKDNMDIGYYNTNNYSVGDKLYSIKPSTADAAEFNLKCFKLNLAHDTIIKVHGHNGGTGVSRMYVVVDKNTREIIEKRGATTTAVTEELTYNVDVEIYFTFNTTNYTPYIEYYYPLTQPQQVEVLEYALVYNKVPTFVKGVIGSALGSITFPAGTGIVATNSNSDVHQISSIPDAITVTQRRLDEGSSYIILNLEKVADNSIDVPISRQVSTSSPVYLNKGEVLIALVRWSEGVYKANFREYMDGDTIVYVTPTAAINKLENLINICYGITTSSSSVSPKSIWGLLHCCGDDVSIDDFEGKTLVNNPTLYTEERFNNRFWAYSFDAKEGEVVIISGHSGTGNSRLWTAVRNNVVVDIAKSGEDTFSSPKVFNITEPTKFYITFANKADYLLRLRNENEEPEDVLKVGKIHNPSLDLNKPEIRVLDIGNSYTIDATHYLSDLISNSDITTNELNTIALVKATRGSGSFKNWVDVYNDADTLPYDVARVDGCGNLQVNISGTAAAHNGEKFRNVLTNNKFDLILIHQVSTYANDSSNWESNTNAGYLKQFVRILRKHQPNATIGFLLVHSYDDNYGSNTEHSALARWQNICEATKQFASEYNVDFIIPYGTAVQNIRASSINTPEMVNFTEDGTHCADGVADYTAACCYFQMLYAPRYNTCILDNPCTITVEPGHQGAMDVDNTIIPSIGKSTRELCQTAAFSACYDMYNVNNPENDLY